MSNPTDTNQASELYELCKGVYGKTGWGIDYSPPIEIEGQHFNESVSCELAFAWQDEKVVDGELFNNFNVNGTVPAYTTDYLLEKLPDGQRVVKVDEAYYVANNVQGLTDVNADGKSALVALLKFTLFLNKEGLL